MLDASERVGGPDWSISHRCVALFVACPSISNAAVHRARALTQKRKPTRVAKYDALMESKRKIFYSDEKYYSASQGIGFAKFRV